MCKMEFIFVEVKAETNIAQRMGEYKWNYTVIRLLHL